MWRPINIHKYFKIRIVEEIKTHILCSITFSFPENRAVWNNVWKNNVEPDSPQMTIWRMRNACWITNATNTLWIYSLLVQCNGGYTNEFPCYVIRALSVLLTYIAHSYTCCLYLYTLQTLWIYSLLVQCNSGYTNEFPFYVICALSVLLTYIAHSYTYCLYLHMLSVRGMSGK